MIGSERHDSRRIDNRYVAVRTQGDPGESRFYLSLDDELMRLFARCPAWAMGRFDDDEAIEARWSPRRSSERRPRSSKERRDPQ